MTQTKTEQLFEGAVTVRNGAISITDASRVAGPYMDTLVRQAVFGTEDQKADARWLIWEIAQAVGIHPASIHDLYMARGKGAYDDVTVPAINVRGMAYDTARAVFRAANKLNAGAFVLEIARSEIAYTDQRPGEYASVMLAAAIREGFRGPLFIQGDHFQISAKKFATNPDQEAGAVKQLAVEAVAAGFYNIDIDTSTLVDLSKPTLAEQQRTNVEQCADIAAFIRGLQPAGITISLGGEIGEVGTENSTPEELRAYMDGFNSLLGRESPGTEGLSKVSVQSGTSHGGIVLPDGSIKEVAIDFGTLTTLSDIARKEYGLAGAVQHGASTLPDELFHKFPGTGACEIHLATNFQNMLFDHMHESLRSEIYAWLDVNTKDERKPTDTDEQFYYKTRKKALGPFKRKIWDMPADVKETMARAYDEKFGFLFRQLNIHDTRDLVAKYVHTPAQHRPMPHPDLAVVEAAPDDADLSD
ncbi:MAG TPA: class II fructose-bisphosphate aldolase [Gemmatimonadaceae bacterium]|nr:class II fructose-bisphosphate aldolase [Gemmatimonadaceae bacterium]